jgi:hypothetical protein
MISNKGFQFFGERKIIRRINFSDGKITREHQFFGERKIIRIINFSDGKITREHQFSYLRPLREERRRRIELRARCCWVFLAVLDDLRPLLRLVVFLEFLRDLRRDLPPPGVSRGLLPLPLGVLSSSLSSSAADPAAAADPAGSGESL